MVTINENIRWYKPNDPYYYEVDNLPLIDLLNNDKSLRDAVQAIENANLVWASQAYVQERVQSAVGLASIIDTSTSSTTTYNNVIDWVESKNYLTSVLTKVGELIDVNAENPSDGDIITWRPNEVNAEGDPGVWKSEEVSRKNFKEVRFRHRKWVIGQERYRLGTQTSQGYDEWSPEYMSMETTYKTWGRDNDGDLYDTTVRRFLPTWASLDIPLNVKRLFVGGYVIEAFEGRSPDNYDLLSVISHSNGDSWLIDETTGEEGHFGQRISAVRVDGINGGHMAGNDYFAHRVLDVGRGLDHFHCYFHRTPYKYKNSAGTILYKPSHPGYPLVSLYITGYQAWDW